MIEVNGVSDVRQIQSAVNNNRLLGKAGANGPVSAEAGKENGVDEVKISPEAAFRSQLEAASRPYTRKMAEEASAQRLESLKEKYQGDSCPVQGMDVARAMLSRVWGTSR